MTKCCTKTLSFLSWPIFTSNIKHYNNIIRNSILNNFWNNTGVLFSLEGCFFYLETERFLPVIRDKFRKLSGIEGFRYRREFKQFCSLLRRCRERKEKSAIDKFFFGIDWAITVTMQPSFTTIKTATACEQSLHLRDIEKSHAPVASERRGGSKVRERKWELFVSSAPRSLNAHSRVRLPLEMERLLPVHNISW